MNCDHVSSFTFWATVLWSFCAGVPVGIVVGETVRVKLGLKGN